MFVPAAECPSGYRYVKLQPLAGESIKVEVARYDDGKVTIVKDFELEGKQDHYAFHVTYVKKSTSF